MEGLALTGKEVEFWKKKVANETLVFSTSLGFILAGNSLWDIHREKMFRILALNFVITVTSGENLLRFLKSGENEYYYP